MNNIVNEKMKIDSMKHITKKMKLSVIDDSEIFYIPLAQHIRTDFKRNSKKGGLCKTV
jgi:electron transport complex protein rnfC